MHTKMQYPEEASESDSRQKDLDMIEEDFRWFLFIPSWGKFIDLQKSRRRVLYVHYVMNPCIPHYVLYHLTYALVIQTLLYLNVPTC